LGGCDGGVHHPWTNRIEFTEHAFAGGDEFGLRVVTGGDAGLKAEELVAQIFGFGNDVFDEVAQIGSGCSGVDF